MTVRERGPNRWLILTAGWIITFFIAGITVFSVFLKPLEETYPNLEGISTWAFSLYNFAQAIAGILVGPYVDRHGPRVLIYSGAILYGGAWCFGGSTGSPPLLFLIFIIGGIGCGMIYNPVITTTLKWFSDIKGKISGVLLSAAGIGPAVIAPVANRILDHYGVVNTLRILGIVYCIVIIVCAGAMKVPHHLLRTHEDEAETHEDAPAALAVTGKQFAPVQMIKTMRFWLCFAVIAITGAAGTMMVSSISPISQHQVGAVGAMEASAVGALMVSVYTISNFIGRLSFGVIFDRFGSYVALLLSISLTILALIGLSQAHSVAMLSGCAVILGFAFGAVLVCFPAITERYFGVINLTANYGIMFLGYAVGSFIGPRLTSSLFYPETTGYTYAYYSAIVLALIGAILVLVLRRKDRHDFTATAQKEES